MRTLIPTIALALLPALAQAQVKPLPWAGDPLSYPALPYRKVETVDGIAMVWAYTLDGKNYAYEVHCTWAVCTPSYLALAASDFVKSPATAFWARAKTSSCLDPKGFWPTAQERNLCVTVRAEMAALKLTFQ